MNFGFPQFLWALTALSIPLLIHLFNFRKAKTVFFSNTKFLKRLEQESKVVKKLRYWLVFAMRALALALLVFAFAQPYEDSEDERVASAETVHHLYLDNSYSMKRSGEEGPLFYQAKKIAISILQSLPESAKVQVYSNEGSLSLNRYNSPKIAIDQLDRMDYHSRFLSLFSLMQLVRSNYKSGTQNQVYLISDFQNSLIAGETPIQSKTENINLLPLRSIEGIKNISIDSIAFEKPIFVDGMEQNLSVWLQGSESDAKSLSLEFKLNDSLYSAQLVEINKGVSQKIEIPFTVPKGAFHKAELSIDKGKPDYDNHFYFAFQNQKPPLVYGLGENIDPQVEELYKNRFFNYYSSTTGNVDYSKLDAADLILVNSDQSLEKLKVNLQNHLSKGANLWFLPSKSAPSFQRNLTDFGIQLSDSWMTDSLRAQNIDYKDPFYQDVFVEEIKNPDLPFTKSHLRELSPQSKTLIRLSNGNALVARKTAGKGQIFYALSRLEKAHSNIMGHESFMPLLANAALFQDQGISYYLAMGKQEGHQDINAIGGADQTLSMEWNGSRIIPAQSYKEGRYSIYNDELNNKPGHYSVFLEEERIAYLAINMDRRESDLQTIDGKGLIQFFGTEANIIDTQEKSSLTKLEAGLTSKDKSLGAIFIFAVLLFLALEMILLWKRTT